MMQSSTNNHYLPAEFNENFFYESTTHPDEDLFFQSDPIHLDYHGEVEKDPEVNEKFSRGTFNGKSKLMMKRNLMN